MFLSNKKSGIGIAIMFTFVGMSILYALVAFFITYQLAYLFLFLFGVLSGVTIIYYYNKIYQIEFLGDKFYVKNLFKDYVVKKSDFISIENTSFSPLVYALVCKERKFHFSPRSFLLLKQMLTFDHDAEMKKMNEYLKNKCE